MSDDVINPIGQDDKKSQHRKKSDNEISFGDIGLIEALFGEPRFGDLLKQIQNNQDFKAESEAYKNQIMIPLAIGILAGLFSNIWMSLMTAVSDSIPMTITTAILFITIIIIILIILYFYKLKTVVTSLFLYILLKGYFGNVDIQDN